MAFTEAEKLEIAKIIRITPSLLDAHITVLGADLTVAKEAAVRDEIARWEESGGKFVKLHPTESNYGVETNAGDAKGDIRRNIAILLELNYAFPISVSMGTLQIG